MPRIKPYRCSVCLHEFDQFELKGKKGCPFCESERPMQLIAEDGFIRANWADMQLLAQLALKTVDRLSIGDVHNLDTIAAFDRVVEKISYARPRGSAPLYYPRKPRLTNYKLEINDTAELKPDASGLIPSPYIFKKPPQA